MAGRSLQGRPRLARRAAREGDYGATHRAGTSIGAVCRRLAATAPSPRLESEAKRSAAQPGRIREKLMTDHEARRAAACDPGRPNGESCLRCRCVMASGCFRGAPRAGRIPRNAPHCRRPENARAVNCAGLPFPSCCLAVPAVPACMVGRQLERLIVLLYRGTVGVAASRRGVRVRPGR